MNMNYTEPTRNPERDELQLADANATIERIWKAYNPIERSAKGNFICEAIRAYYEKWMKSNLN